jgi:acyl carrier protein
MSLELSNKVIETVASQLGLPKEQVKLDSNFTDDLGADSLDLVEMMMALEEQFEVTIADEAAEKLTTVQSIVDYIELNKGRDL